MNKRQAKKWKKNHHEIMVINELQDICKDILKTMGINIKDVKILQMIKGSNING